MNLGGSGAECYGRNVYILPRLLVKTKFPRVSGG